TNSSSAACGYTFEKNTSYLVYARESEGRLHVSLCSRTRPMAEAADDLVVLGAGATPVHIEPKQRGAAASAGHAAAPPDAGTTGKAGPGASSATNKGVEPLPANEPPKPAATSAAPAEKAT